MFKQEVNPGSAFLRWFVLSIIGFAIGVILFLAVGSILGQEISESPSFVEGAILGLIFGASFGIVHWLFIKQYFPNSTIWILATVIPFMVAASIIYGLMINESFVYNIIHSILVGLSLGIGQWLVIRRYEISNPSLWILFSVIGWIIAEIVGTFTEDLMYQPIPFFLTFLTGGTVVGIGMIWLLKQNAS